jgi:Cu-Zn family superoxide dismutase
MKKPVCGVMPRMRRLLVPSMVALASLVIAMATTGCASLAGNAQPTKAIATIRAVQGAGISGTVAFIPEQGKIRVVVDVRGLPPGKHGIHVHEYGDLSAPDGSSVGGHFNPTNQPHGAPTDAQRHLGDLGNIEADRNGVAKTSFLVDRISLTGPNSIIGRSAVIKERADDFKTQPAGAAGARIAWGIIGYSANPSE